MRYPLYRLILLCCCSVLLLAGLADGLSWFFLARGGGLLKQANLELVRWNKHALYTEAIRCLDRANWFNPQHPPLFIFAADVLVGLQMVDKDFLSALGKKNGSLFGNVEKSDPPGKTAERMLIEQAIRLLKQASKLVPTESDYHYRLYKGYAQEAILSSAEERAGLEDKANDEREKACELFPRNITLYRVLIQDAIRAEAYERAFEYFILVAGILGKEQTLLFIWPMRELVTKIPPLTVRNEKITYTRTVPEAERTVFFPPLQIPTTLVELRVFCKRAGLDTFPVITVYGNGEEIGQALFYREEGDFLVFQLKNIREQIADPKAPVTIEVRAAPAPTEWYAELGIFFDEQ